MANSNMFDDPKSLKTWAIKLANACGGQKVEKSIMLTKTNPQRLRELLDEFVTDHNENTIKIANEMNEQEKKEEE
ncbi:hypothetical protein [uncultured Mediterranean phage uvMED]|nr:hypothetical protein [uncultured Mediterranean phage uvMED]